MSQEPFKPANFLQASPLGRARGKGGEFQIISNEVGQRPGELIATLDCDHTYEPWLLPSSLPMFISVSWLYLIPPQLTIVSSCCSCFYNTAAICPFPLVAL